MLADVHAFHVLLMLFRDAVGVRGKDKSGAPPVQGLLEQIASPAQTPDRSRVYNPVVFTIGNLLP